MMKTVLFTLNAGHAHAALSVRILRDALERAGMHAEVIEATERERTHNVLARLAQADAALYGFSCYIWNIDAMLALAADLKRLLPECRIVLGGPEVSFDTDRFTALDFIDCVVSGEGEQVIAELARLVEQGQPLPRLWQAEPSDAFLHRGVHYAPAERDAHLVYYESSRGCPFSCAFCLSSASEGVRAKSAEQTLSELAEFERLDTPVTVKLVDRTVNFDRERAKAIWRGLLSERYTKCYHFEIAAHLLDRECFEILSKFPKGKVRLEIGLQSTNERTLATIARHADAQRVLAAAKRLCDAGNLHVHLDLIAGLPHEDYASFARSFDAAYFCCDVLQLGFLKLLHGTALRRDARELGIVYSEKAPYTVLKTRDISFEELERLHVISDLMERLRDSGRFVHTLWLLLPRFFTPFAFYEGFADFLAREDGRPLQKIAQRDLFTHLARFARERLPVGEHERLGELLRADFASAEVRKPPHGL
jgi:radical SAM superfamily enzyme YgiQ (UPF0313 family)